MNRLDKKNYTLTELIVVLVIGMIFLSIAAVIVIGAVFGYKAYKSINEDGAQQTIERVWEGPTEAEGPQDEAEKPEEKSQ